MSDPVRLIEIKEEIHADNERVAQALRLRLEAKKTFVLNVMSSPGAGKTTTLLRTIDTLRDRFRFGVLEADIDSTVDADLIAARGISAVQLRTGGFCHLDAAMVSKGLGALDLEALDIVVVENIGNLVCPAEFDTGAIRNAMILSVPEGDDKPLKYPLMFTVSDVLLVNKIDYLAVFGLRPGGHARAGPEPQSRHPDFCDFSKDRAGLRSVGRLAEPRGEQLHRGGARHFTAHDREVQFHFALLEPFDAKSRRDRIRLREWFANRPAPCAQNSSFSNAFGVLSIDNANSPGHSVCDRGGFGRTDHLEAGQQREPAHQRDRTRTRRDRGVISDCER